MYHLFTKIFCSKHAQRDRDRNTAVADRIQKIDKERSCVQTALLIWHLSNNNLTTLFCVRKFSDFEHVNCRSEQQAEAVENELRR